MTCIERIAEEERIRREEEETRAAEEAKKKAAEEQLAAARKKRDEERAADLEKVRKQHEREEEAERRRANRTPSTAATPPSQAPNEWRRSAQPVERTPIRPSAPTVPKYVAPAVRASEGPPTVPRAGPGGWRERELLKSSSGSRPGTPGRQSPAPTAEEDGFQTVNRPRPTASTGAYRPPGARNR
jgi:translation initiation factor 3 subunit A